MKLLEPIKVGKITLKNRIMFPPLTTGYEGRDGSIGEQSRAFYTRLAKGGVGYIVIGDVVPVPTVSPTPKLYMDSQIESFKLLADAVHQYDTKLALQIFHPDYDAEVVTRMVGECFALKGKAMKLKEMGDASWEAVAKEASEKEKAAFGKLHYDMTHFISEVSEEKLGDILNKIKACVDRAIKAGVDVIEVHGDRLVGSLCSTILNHRTDSYGGSFENRTRFALQVVRAIREASADICIDYKLPVVTYNEDGSVCGKGGLFVEEAVELAKILEKEGVDMIHVAQANHTGNMNDTIPAMGTRKYVFMINETKAIKDAVSIPVSLVGRAISTQAAEALINEGVCDIVAYGRELLCDPDIANKLAEGRANEIRQCISCNKGCTDSIMGRKFLSCVLNAENGYETTREIKPATTKKTVAVVGAGVAGLEAARVLAIKGHHVDVYEKSLKLGGQINIASVPPRKEEMNRILHYYENVLANLDVTFHFGHEFTKVDAAKYSDIIVAIGAHNLTPRIPGINAENVVSAWDVLANKAITFGKIAVCGGGLVGAETAEYLANKGYEVTVIEMMDKIAAQESATILPSMMADFKKHNVELRTLNKVKEINENGVLVELLEKKEDGTTSVKAEELIKANTVVIALTSVKNVIDLEGIPANIIYVGDCGGERPSTIENAIKTGYDAANSIN
ncbi:MAG: FAD-dependent oxidoreductase [Bacilli bacterium]|nr:FAD-dependent oxidoreductase [Bacilli bacterium]